MELYARSTALPWYSTVAESGAEACRIPCDALRAYVSSVEHTPMSVEVNTVVVQPAVPKLRSRESSVFQDMLSNDAEPPAQENLLNARPTVRGLEGRRGGYGCASGYGLDSVLLVLMNCVSKNQRFQPFI